MEDIDQTKQVFVDDTGRRGRLLVAGMRLACVVVAGYLFLLLAGFLGASWVPSVRLPGVGNIFDVGRGGTLPAQAAPVEVGGGGGDAENDAVTVDETEEPSEATETDDSEDPAATAADGAHKARSAGRPGGGNREKSAQPAPQASPNRGAASGNPNAGPKPRNTPRPQPTPNHGSNGNSENAGPKPKPTKTPGPPAESGRGQKAEPSPSPGV